jgi:hypothetical protein
MKTLFYFDGFGEYDSGFFELEGDYSHLDGTVMNETEDQDKQKELSKILYDDEGNDQQELQHAPTKDWDFYVYCGFMP